MDGLVVSREAPPHPDLPDIYTLGECLTEAWPSEWQGPETMRSVVVLYWGSFRELSRLNPAFDWEGELWETLTHELRHHLESLAAEDALEGVDYALDEGFKRYEGLDFDPWYYQHGEEEAEGVFRVETHRFVERSWGEGELAPGDALTFELDGATWTVPVPGDPADVHYLWVEGATEPPETLEVVLVRKRSWWQDVKRLLGASRPRVEETGVRAAPGGGGSQPPDPGW